MAATRQYQPETYQKGAYTYNLHEHVADEQDGDSSVELHAGHIEILLKIVEARLGDSVAVYVVLSFS